MKKCVRNFYEQNWIRLIDSFEFLTNILYPYSYDKVLGKKTFKIIIFKKMLIDWNSENFWKLAPKRVNVLLHMQKLVLERPFLKIASLHHIQQYKV